MTIHPSQARGRAGLHDREQLWDRPLPSPGFLGIKAPARIDSRYLTEDIGYTGLLHRPRPAPGRADPTMDAIIELTSVVLGRDLRAEAARTMRSLAWTG